MVAAFGLVRGSAQADMLQLSASNPFETDTLAQVNTVHTITSNETSAWSVRCCC